MFNFGLSVQPEEKDEISHSNFQSVRVVSNKVCLNPSEQLNCPKSLGFSNSILLEKEVADWPSCLNKLFSDRQHFSNVREIFTDKFVPCFRITVIRLRSGVTFQKNTQK